MPRELEIKQLVINDFRCPRCGGLVVPGEGCVVVIEWGAARMERLERESSLTEIVEKFLSKEVGYKELREALELREAVE